MSGTLGGICKLLGLSDQSQLCGSKCKKSNPKFLAKIMNHGLDKEQLRIASFWTVLCIFQR